MKKSDYPVFPGVSFAISVFFMACIFFLAVEAVIGYIQMPEYASGADYLGFFIYPVLCVPMAWLGTISSAFCGIKTTIIWVKIVSFVLLAIYLAIWLPPTIYVIRMVLYSWGHL